MDHHMNSPLRGKPLRGIPSFSLGYYTLKMTSKGHSWLSSWVQSERFLYRPC